LTNLILYIKLNEESSISNIDISIIKNIKYTINGVNINYQDDFIKIHDELFIDKKVKDERNKYAKKGYLIYKLPIFWDLFKSFTLINLMYPLQISIEFRESFNYESAKLYSNYIFLNPEERREFAHLKSVINPWISIYKEFTITESRKTNIEITPKNISKGYMFIILDEYNNKIPFKILEVIWNNQCIEYITEPLLKYKMAINHNLITEENIYYSKDNDNCDLSNIEKISFIFTFSNNIKIGEYKLCYYQSTILTMPFV